MAFFLRKEEISFQLTLPPEYQPLILVVKVGEDYGVSTHPGISTHEVRETVDALIEYLRTALPTN